MGQKRNKFLRHTGATVHQTKTAQAYRHTGCVVVVVVKENTLDKQFFFVLEQIGESFHKSGGARTVPPK